MNKKQAERNRRRPAWRVGRSNLAESCPQRILRRVLHEGDLGAMTPREVYDATVHAVLRERGITYQDLDDVAAETMRLENRWRWARAHRGETAMEITGRLDLEAGVLKWAMDEIAAMLRPGSRHGGGCRDAAYIGDVGRG